MPRRHFGAFLTLVLLFGILPFQPAWANGGDFTLNFRSATPTTYDHTTGTGGVFGDSVVQLNGGDFACGDKVVHFVSIHVDGSPTAATQSAQVNLSFDTQSTGQDGAGYRSLFSVGPNTGDPAHTADGDSAVNLITNDFSPVGDATPGLVSVEVTGLEANETFILRVVVELGCDPGSSPTGNIQARVTSAAVTGPPAAVSTINVGAQTTPLMQAGLITQPGIDITKTADAAVVSAGDQVGFTIVVSNPGTGATTAVHVTDALPGNAGLNWSLSPAVTGCSISGAIGAQQLVCDFASLAAAASSAPIHVISQTTAAFCGTLNNTALVSTGNDGSDQAAASIEVRCPDLTVTKTPLQPIVTEGGTATFTIQVTNSGIGTAHNVTVTDTLPTAGGPNAWTESPDIAACSITLGVLSCNFGDLAPGATASVTVTKLLGTGCAQLLNTATVGASNEPQSALGNNSAQATITVTCAALSIAKVADDPSVSAGDPVGFTITVINGGAAAATNVVVTDNLPGNAGLNWSESPDLTDCAITGALGSQVLNCTLPTVPANGGTVIIHVVSPTTPATCGTITNSVGLATGAPAVATITVDCPDVTVIKTADDDTINAGDNAAFTILVRNNGPGTATGVTLSDTLPDGISWIDDSTDCSISLAGVLSCTFGTLTPNETRTIALVGVTDSADCGLLTNTATVAATNEPVGAQGNNSSTATITVNCPDVTVTKTAVNPTINAGATAAFTIVVTNLGPGTATNVTLNDQLPAGIAWSEDSGECTISLAGVLSCTFVGPLAPGETRTIHLTGPTDRADCGLISNAATVAASNEPSDVLGNNSAAATITVVCPPPAYGTDPNTLPEERPYDPAPGSQPVTQDQPSADPGSGVAGTTVPVTPVAGPSDDSGNPVVEAVLGAIETQVNLPRTGGEIIQQGIAGLILVGAGLLLLAVRRRRSSSTPA